MSKQQRDLQPTKKHMTLKERLKLWFLLGWVAFLILTVIAILAMKEFNIQGRKIDGRDLAVHEVVDGVTLEIWEQAQLEAAQDRIVWCVDTTDGSHVGRNGSMNGSAKNDIFRDLCNGYGPDVYPKHERNSGKSWEPQDPDRGQEWVIAQWNRRSGPLNSLEPVRAKAIIIVETFNPGAVVAVDVIGNYYAEDGNKSLQVAMKKTRLWSGKMESAQKSRVTVLRLKEPTTISVLRLILNTKQVPGYNSLDTIGLLY